MSAVMLTEHLIKSEDV